MVDFPSQWRSQRKWAIAPSPSLDQNFFRQGVEHITVHADKMNILEKNFVSSWFVPFCSPFAESLGTSLLWDLLYYFNQFFLRVVRFSFSQLFDLSVLLIKSLKYISQGLIISVILWFTGSLEATENIPSTNIIIPRKPNSTTVTIINNKSSAPSISQVNIFFIHSTKPWEVFRILIVISWERKCRFKTILHIVLNHQLLYLFW